MTFTFFLSEPVHSVTFYAGIFDNLPFSTTTVTGAGDAEEALTVIHLTGTMTLRTGVRGITGHTTTAATGITGVLFWHIDLFPDSAKSFTQTNHQFICSDRHAVPGCPSVCRLLHRRTLQRCLQIHQKYPEILECGSSTKSTESSVHAGMTKTIIFGALFPDHSELHTLQSLP